MTEEKMALEEFHKKIAISTNNGIWPALDKEHPSKEELEDALHMAHTSYYHWSKIGQPINRARAEYMISRVYCALEWAEPAIYHAKRCLEITEETSIGDFDLAFAFEVMARAYSIAKNRSECKKYYDLSKKAIETIKGEEDRKICQSELDRVRC
ncbi:hypothetical protein EU527_14125 [Candidatus Thorarchaeota archaeon]|nr:MAG: hypothetical protein EU527_14125 [Candidatus Thorarchaeota archaeon]